MPPISLAPPRVARPYVERLWGVERRFAPGERFTILPDSYVELIVSAGAPCELVDGASVRPLSRCYLVGLLDAPLQLRAEGLLRVAGVRMFAWGLLPILGRPPGGGPLRDLGGAWPELAGAAAALSDGDMDGALALLGELVAARAALVPEGERVAELPRALARPQGRVRVSEVAAAHGLSPRQAERRVRAAAGCSPGALARLARFQLARDRLWQEPGADLAALALECGYADQAHLTRDFRRFSGSTPARFAQQMRAARAAVLGAAIPHDSGVA